MLSAYRAGLVAFEHALADANPEDRLLPAEMVDPELQRVKADLLADQQQGMVGRGTFTLHPKITAAVGDVSQGGRLRLKHGRVRVPGDGKARAAGDPAGERRGDLDPSAFGRDVEGLEADRDGRQVRARLLTSSASLA